MCFKYRNALQKFTTQRNAQQLTQTTTEIFPSDEPAGTCLLLGNCIETFLLWSVLFAACICVVSFCSTLYLGDIVRIWFMLVGL